MPILGEVRWNIMHPKAKKYNRYCPNDANDQYKHIVPEAKSTTYMYSRGQKTL
jgi:hypothetical protein